MNDDIAALVEQVRSDARTATRAAARLMTLLENRPERLPELYEGHHQWPQPRLVLGITGPPGAGKSTLTDKLVADYRARYPDRRVGVVAVDPSSPYTGGALLGDRVRMMGHATDPLVFVRSLASRGHLGGLALGVKGVLRVMSLIGCDLVLIETVGVGQSEVEVAQIADLVAVVLAPGQGDGIQMLKAGLMEAGDLFVVNKADRDGAGQLASHLRNTLRMANGRGRRVSEAQICLTNALDRTGIDALLDLLEQLVAEGGQRWRDDRGGALERDIAEAVLEDAARRFREVLRDDGLSRRWIADVLRGERSVADVTDWVIDRTSRVSTNKTTGD